MGILSQGGLVDPAVARRTATRIVAASEARADELIDAINNLAGAKLFLKRLCKRLVKNNVLP